MTQDIEFYWDGIQWNESMKTDITYDTSGNMILNTTDSWNGEQWIEDSKLESIYEDNENIIQTLSYGWDGDLNQWINDSKIEYTYDANWNLTLFDVYYEDFNFLKIESVYDDSGNSF